MCLIFIAFKIHPDYKIILASNRDEFYKRPSTSIHWWKQYPFLLAGRDLKSQGSWFGITRTGKIATVTNFRDPYSVKHDCMSRGVLVTDYLIKSFTPNDYLDRIRTKNSMYNGYNMIFGTSDELYYYSNRASSVQPISPGIHGLSNHLLNTPWPKVEKGKSMFTNAIFYTKPFSIDSIFSFLRNRDIAPDDMLPQTGVDRAWERLLSPIFIVSPDYGTRSSTVLTVDYDNKVALEERSYIPETRNTYHFHLSA